MYATDQRRERDYIVLYILLGLSPRENHTDRATAACRRSKCQLSRIKECRVVSAADPLRP
jgi:hypothetical protein